MSDHDPEDHDMDEPGDDFPMIELPMPPMAGGTGRWAVDGNGEEIERPGPEVFADVAAECPPDLPDLRDTSPEELAVMEIANRAAMDHASMQAALLQAKSHVISLIERRRMYQYLREKGARRVPAGCGTWDSALLDVEGELAAATAYYHKVRLYALNRAKEQRRG